MNKLSTVKSIISDKWYAFAACITTSSILLQPLNVFAKEITLPTSKTNINSVVISLINIICDVFRYIGILLLCWSVGMLVMAFKNEDADSKSRAMMLLVVSAVLIGIKEFLTRVL